MGFETIITIGIVFFILWMFYNDFKKRTTIHIDSRGYERNGYDRLVHRDVAYNEIYKEGYKEGTYSERFGSYDIHHIDRNKRNNSPDNLQILSREEHEAIHHKYVGEDEY